MCFIKQLNHDRLFLLYKINTIKVIIEIISFLSKIEILALKSSEYNKGLLEFLHDIYTLNGE